MKVHCRRGKPIIKTYSFFFAIFFTTTLLAHGGSHDKKKKKSAGEAKSNVQENEPNTEKSKELESKLEEALKSINTEYLADVKPIFREKCLPCHGEAKGLPWYASVPGPKHLIQADIKEAREHLDMREDFPFGGHGSPKEDLEEVLEATKKGSMPPLRYRIMHWDSALTEAEEKTIEQWVNQSLETLTGLPAIN